MRRNIPNIITLLNLFCGCCALVSILNGQMLQTFLFVFVGSLADYSDGMAARWLEVKSPFGKELDSLADMVTFGAVPGAILYMLINFGWQSSTAQYPADLALLLQLPFSVAALPAFIISVFAALRLAKFNLDTRQSEDFIGLNTPACTMFIVGLMLIYHFDSFGLRSFVGNLFLLYALIPVLSFLLVTELPMVSFKFKGFQWKGNERRFVFLLLGITLLIVLQEAAFSPIIIIYVLISLFDYLFTSRPTL